MRLLRVAMLTVAATGAAAACSLAKPSSEVAAAVPVSVAFESLTERLGCDESFVVRDPKGTLVLTALVPGILERSRDKELPYEEEVSIGRGALIVELEAGFDLYHSCTDAMDRPPRIENQWLGVSGTARVRVVERVPREGAGIASGRSPPSVAVLSLGPVVLAAQGAAEERLTLPAIEIEAILGVPSGG